MPHGANAAPCRDYGGLNLRSISVFALVLSLSAVALMAASDLSSATVSTGLTKGSAVEQSFNITFGEGGGRDPSLSLYLPKSGPVTDASFKVSTIEGESAPYKVFIDIGLDNRNEWGFGGGDEGGFGLQDTFLGGQVSHRTIADSEGSSLSFFLPQGARVSSASVIVSSPPSPESAGERERMASGFGGVDLESFDAADIDGDGKGEVFLFSQYDNSLVTISEREDGTFIQTTVKEGVIGPVFLRALEEKVDQKGGAVLSYLDQDQNRYVSFLSGDAEGKMTETVLASGLNSSNVGFSIRRNGPTEPDSIMVQYSREGGLMRARSRSDGTIATNVIADRSIAASGIAELDLDGDGDLDILLVPEPGSGSNATILEAWEQGNGTEYSPIISDIRSWSSGVLEVADANGDGREEAFLPIGPYGSVAVLHLSGENGLSLSYAGINGTSVSIRTLPRTMYGMGPIYIGGESLVYVIDTYGITQLLPEGSLDGPYVARRSLSLGGASVVRPELAAGDVFTLTQGGQVLRDGVRWQGEESVKIQNLMAGSSVDIWLGPPRMSSADILPLAYFSQDMPGKTDQSGNLLKRFDLSVTGTGSIASISGLFIDYDITLDASSSRSTLTSIEKARTDFGGERIPLSIGGSTPGKVEVGPAVTTYDSPPSILPSLPLEVSVLEDSMGTTLFNVRDHLEDDLLPVEDLSIRVAPVAQDLPSGLLFTDRNGNLVSHASAFPDLFGEFPFVIEVSDLRSTAASPQMVLKVLPSSDPPRQANGLGPLTVVEGETLSTPMWGEDGLFMDPDGDDIFISWELTPLSKGSLTQPVSISMTGSELSISPGIEGAGGSFMLDLVAYDANTPIEEGVRIPVKLSVIDMDSPPVVWQNPGSLELSEDMDLPLQIPIEGWLADPDTPLSDLHYEVYTSDARLIGSIGRIGGKPYLLLQPTNDLTGRCTVWLEVVSQGSTILDKLLVDIVPINDIPEVVIDTRRVLEGRGWMVSGHVTDPDDEGGKIEFKTSAAEWKDGWGFETWSFLVDFTDVPRTGGFIFIRAFDGEEYSSTVFLKLVPPEEIPEPPIKPDDEVPDDDDDNDDDDDTPPNIVPEEPGSSSPPWLLLGGAAGAVLSVLAFLLWTEIGFVAIVTAASTIYSKLSKKDILNHEIRGLIRGYIIANPGDHYSSIKRNLDLNNGTLAYHLRVLEQSGFIKSMYDGIYKRYYPANINVSKLKKNISKQEEIFNIILEHPGVTMEEIGRAIGVSRQVVNYHVKNLIRAGAVTYLRDRKSAKFYPSAEAAPMETT